MSLFGCRRQLGEACNQEFDLNVTKQRSKVITGTR